VYFRRFYDEWLAQASYLVGCAATGEAVVVDPARVIDPYLEAARAEGFRITAVTETHIHADFLSGLRELAAATGARMHVSGCGTPEWQYGFRHDPAVAVLADRDRLEIGNVLLEAVHTPGHTPEHLSFLVTDRAAATEPIGVLTGDFVFVGDVGRPDLLEKAARVANTAAAGAEALFDSLAWFRRLPDHLQVWPGHGAGSACGKGLSAMPQSTVGYERRYNWALGLDDRADFVRQVLLGQPEPPRYFGLMKRMNREGPAVLGALPRPPLTTLDGLLAARAAGAILVDTRPTAEFARGHMAGALNIPLGRSFTTYAGSLLPYDRDLVCLLSEPSPARVRQLVEGAVSIGLDRVAAVHGPDLLGAWEAAGHPVGAVPAVTPADLLATGGGRLLLDVRNRSEWEAGHLPGARLLPLAELVDRLDEVPAGADVIAICQSGSRSAVAASVLRAAGHRTVANLAGGFSGWVGAGGPIER
jgi:hydroxyacylglutathione hydrolase